MWLTLVMLYLIMNPWHPCSISDLKGQNRLIKNTAHRRLNIIIKLIIVFHGHLFILENEVAENLRSGLWVSLLYLIETVFILCDNARMSILLNNDEYDFSEESKDEQWKIISKLMRILALKWIDITTNHTGINDFLDRQNRIREPIYWLIDYPYQLVPAAKWCLATNNHSDLKRIIPLSNRLLTILKNQTKGIVRCSAEYSHLAFWLIVHLDTINKHLKFDKNFCI